MNVFTGIGRLGRDAEVRYSSDGKPITSFAVAVDDGFGERKVTSWIDCVLFGERGPKIAEHIRKGDRIGVTGSIRLDTFTTRDGVEKSKIAMRVADVTLLGGKPEGQRQERGGGHGAPRDRPARAEAGRAPNANTDFDDDEIPFVSNRGTW